MHRIVVLVLGLLVLSSSSSLGDVKYVTETLLNVEGAVGTMMKVFGAAKPTKNVEYYKGLKKRSDSFDKKGKLTSSQIVDIENGVFVTINHKDQTFTQMTFEEWKEFMQSAMQQFGSGENVEEQPNQEPEAEVDWDLKVDVQETGNSETIAGKKCNEVILTLDMDAEVTSTEENAEGEPESAKGGMVVTSTHWVYKGGDKAKKEMDDFNLKMAEKLGMMPGQASMKNMMGQIVQSNPQLGDAIEKMKDEGEKLNGLSMHVVTVYETKIDPETAQKMNEERAKEDDEGMEIPTSVGGLLGGFGKKMMKKKLEKKNEVKERNTLMRSDTKVLELDRTNLNASLFDVPSGYDLVTRDQK